jgi:hypothetical protein
LLIEANRAQAGGTAQRTAWWIISRVRGGRVEAMTVSRGQEALLAVFGHEEEAGLFLWSLGPDGGAGDGWRVGETRCGELASVLCGSRGVGGVALDPLPEMLGDGTAHLVGVGRERFLARLLGLPRPGPAGRARKVA